MTLLNLQGISKIYESGYFVLKGIDLNIRAHQRLGIVGETGSGKSTLLKIMAGQLMPDKGTISYKDQPMENPEEQLIPGHPEIAYLSQNFELPKFLTVEDYLFDPYEISEADASNVYKACNILHLLTSKTHTLSGGERQRVALAGLLMKSPKVLLLDEPFSNLDYHHKIMMKQVIDHIEKELDTTLVLVSHDPIDTLSWADQILVLRKGQIEQKDTPENLYNRPVNEYVAALFGAYNLFDSDELEPIIKEKLTRVNQKYLVRPESIKLVKDTPSIMQGTIVDKLYFGSHEMIVVKVGKREVLVYSKVNRHQVGEKGGISFVH